MAFGSSKSKGRSSGGSRGGFSGGSRAKGSGGGGGRRKEHNIKNIGAVWEGKYGLSITTNDYHGELLFRDKESGDLFLVKSIRVTDPYNDRKGLLNDLSINLNNDKQCENLGSGDD